MKVLVAIPTYNCKPQIGRVLDGFDENLIGRVNKIIIIDNGSIDGTVEAAIDAAEKLNSNKVEVWKNDANYSLGGSHKVAFLAAEKMGCNYVAILHGDDQANTQELGLLLDKAEANPDADAILGSRFSRGSKLVGYDWKRIWGNRVLNVLYTVVSGIKTEDLGSGLNLFKTSTLRDRQYLSFGDNMAFNFDLLLNFYTKHAKLIYHPITWTEEDQVTNARNWKVARLAVEKLVAWRFNKLSYPVKKASEYSSTRIS